MLARWRQNLREQRDSPSRGRSGVTPAWSRPVHPLSRKNHMNRQKPTDFRNSLDLTDKVQVKILRRRLKLSDEQFRSVVRKSGSSIAAIIKEAASLK
ncbi:DUF3606 domain-containing protein [Bradyrhizobium liaoningense]|nr:DUF3606 domain-containing protein [Bradyrhizobium liaoningense]MBR0903156.1 DUF3606 domain-containing protein [Bradyrhizobium liaoningense]